MHVLGLPPAFVLSQDQTLKLKAPNHQLPESKPVAKALSLTRLNRSHIVIMPQTTAPKDHGKRHVKLTTHIIGAETPSEPISKQSVRRNETKPPAYPFE